MLVGVGIRQGGGPVLRRSGAIVSATNAATETSCLQTPGSRFAFELGDASVDDVSDTYGTPPGLTHPATWRLPTSLLGSTALVRGTSSTTTHASAGRYATGSAAGTSTATAVGSVVIYGTGTTTGASTATAAASVGQNATASAAGTSTATADSTVLLGSTATATGTSTATASSRVLVNATAQSLPYTDLSAEAVVALLLAADIEPGLTFETAMRRIAATTTHLSAGGGTGTRTFRDAADTKDRVTASVDASGNRTAITFDDD